MGGHATVVERAVITDLQRIKGLQSLYRFKIIAEDLQKDKIFKDIIQGEQSSKKRLLGQIDTPDWIADYIAALCIAGPKDRGIEPCFGKGVFITTIAKRLAKLNRDRWSGVANQITGIEIDPSSFIEGVEEYKQLLPKNVTLENMYLGNFFDFHKNRESYNFGIMNPPYVRQEELSSTSLPRRIRKENLLEVLKEFIPDDYLSRKANLYFYFFLHLSSFLKEGGKLAAITYNSWLYTKSGKVLQRFFLDNFKLKYVIDFDKEAFKDALIGSCIVILEKATGTNMKKIRDDNHVQFIRLRIKAPLSELIEATESHESNSGFVHRHTIRQSDLYHDDKWEKYFYLPTFHEKLVQNPKLIPLSQLARVYRGLGPRSSRFFIINSEDIDRFKLDSEYIIPILKNPKYLKSLRTSDIRNQSFLLHVSERKIELSKYPKAEGVLKYLSYVEGRILSEAIRSKYVSALINMDNEGWYIQKVNGAGEIIFSYIIRENKQFYLNDSMVTTTDNFHNLIPKVDKYALFAVLNSSLTKYLLEIYGRTQGSGLLKVQVYELCDMLVPNLYLAPNNLVDKLSKAGERLSELENRSRNSKLMRNILRRIDELVFEFLGCRKLLEPVIQAEASIIRGRLSRKIKGE